MVTASAGSFPTSEVFNGVKYAAIYVSRNSNAGQGFEDDCRSGESDFDPLPADLTLINIPYSNNHSDCLAVAELQVSAGATECRQGDPGSSSDFSCQVTSGVLSATNTDVSPDPMVSEVFAMMPEVQSLMAALKLYQATDLAGNLELFLRYSVVRGYQGTWSALTEFFADPSQALQARTWAPTTFLEAQISSPRMYIWMCLCLLLVVSGLLLAVVQHSCQAETVSDPAVAAILLDSSEIRHALDNSRDPRDDAEMKFSLEVCADGAGFTETASRTYLRLVPRERSLSVT